MILAETQYLPISQKFIGLCIEDQYRIDNLIGAGGMALVFEAKDIALDSSVAIKILRVDQIPDQEREIDIKRFEAEAKICAKLRQPHTVKVHRHGIVRVDALMAEYPFIVMELLKGQNLWQLLQEARPAPLASDRVVQIAKQICQSLAEAHQQGIVHRDLKPSNIFLDTVPHEQDYVKVLDFGIAKIFGRSTLSRGGLLLGTLSYMSPEQCKSPSVDCRSDIHSLGLILAEMLVGREIYRPPCSQEEVFPLITSKVTVPLPSLATMLPTGGAAPAWLCDLIDRMLCIDPARRPQSVAEVLDCLERSVAPAIRSPQNLETMGNRLPPAPAPVEPESGMASYPLGHLAEDRDQADNKTESHSYLEVEYGIFAGNAVTPGPAGPPRDPARQESAAILPTTPKPQRNKRLRRPFLGVGAAIAVAGALCTWYFSDIPIAKGPDVARPVPPDAVEPSAAAPAMSDTSQVAIGDTTIAPPDRQQPEAMPADGRTLGGAAEETGEEAPAQGIQAINAEIHPGRRSLVPGTKMETGRGNKANGNGPKRPPVEKSIPVVLEPQS